MAIWRSDCVSGRQKRHMKQATPLTRILKAPGSSAWFTRSSPSFRGPKDVQGHLYRSSTSMVKGAQTSGPRTQTGPSFPNMGPWTSSFPSVSFLLKQGSNSLAKESHVREHAWPTGGGWKIRQEGARPNRLSAQAGPFRSRTNWSRLSVSEPPKRGPLSLGHRLRVNRLGGSGACCQVAWPTPQSEGRGQQAGGCEGKGRLLDPGGLSPCTRQSGDPPSHELGGYVSPNQVGLGAGPRGSGSTRSRLSAWPGCLAGSTGMANNCCAPDL